MHSISRRTMFSPDPHLVENIKTIFLSLHLDMVWTELDSHMSLQQGPRSYIPLELTCLFVAFCYEFWNRDSYDGFVLPVERELQKSSIWIFNHGKKLREYALFIKCVSCHKDRDSKKYAWMYYE